MPAGFAFDWTIVALAKQSAHLFHRVLARAPRPFGRAYLELLSRFSRLLPSLAPRIQNSVGQHRWPLMAFRARTVTVASDCKIRLTPHLGEFD
jgi:hypothetical protein